MFIGALYEVVSPAPVVDVISSSSGAAKATDGTRRTRIPMSNVIGDFFTKQSVDRSFFNFNLKFLKAKIKKSAVSR
ncbi:hypothetical protein C9J27_03640 [Photobacterium kishitanii]|uniref:Uncharacterized protein n=1 Tax=Photobacterium kishitanii TaxID=318456 RepID=A0A2T3KN04_9GAMM|nr:hypothetical protein C9J27_03640 [Photobacterium kishitanii]